MDALYKEYPLAPSRIHQLRLQSKKNDSVERDSFYQQYHFESYKMHHLWVQWILDEQREAERKKENNIKNNNRDSFQVVEIVTTPIGVPSNRASKPAVEKQPVNGRQKLQYSREELIRIGCYQRRPPFTFGVKEELSFGKRKRRDEDEFESSRYLARPHSLHRSALNNNRLDTRNEHPRSYLPNPSTWKRRTSPFRRTNYRRR